MYLEKLEIQGFKSFANKNTLIFPTAQKDKRGITVIVGPNGSGKSNAADAVRWVMGEQSMKTLRAKTGEDVIFSGSASKGQLGMAEVSLFLNNEDGQAPIDYSQLVITRRLYRSGESEYLLNNASVRLADIQILLAKANVGQKTYSVIGQGMVESFLTTTATERKEFFDEATGVRQFQIKREQSLNKLIASYENLGQANMLLNEIEPRLKSLTRQVNKLHQRGELEAELRERRLAYFKCAWHKLNDKFSEFNSKFLELEETSRKKTEELSRQNEELARMEESRDNEDFDRLSAAASELQKKREDLLRKLATIDAQLSIQLEAAGNFDLSWLINRENELKGNIERAEAGLTNQRNELSAKNGLAGSFEEEKKKLNQQVAELNGQLRELAEAEKKDTPDEKKVAAKFKEIRDELDKLESENDLGKIKEALVKIKILVAEASELSGGTEAASQSVYVKQREIQEELIRLAKEREDLINRSGEHRLAAASLAEKINLLEQNLSRDRNELEEVRGKIARSQKKEDDSDLKDRKEKLGVELLGLDEEMKKIREQLAGLNNIREEKRVRLFRFQREGQILQQEINRLNNELGNIKIESAKYETRLEDLENEIRKNIDNINEIREHRAENEIDTEETELRIKQLENQLSLIGGIDPEVEKEYGEIKQKYDFLHEQVTDLETAIGTLEGVIRELDGKIKERFDREFKEICKKFEEYFKVLFNGGTAKIMPLHEDELDKEESGGNEGISEKDKQSQELQEKIKRLSKYNATGLAGIEIQACPPGKKIASINMLSGGEKALTAIALICAIISANPSPFVFLDEVDAALDESNSERLARILEDLSHKTQFIVITHNRAPMHRANILYGVTMQENGISKLLSIKLEDYIKQ